eukprot:gnl/Trimastix_PCT/1101.p2 GENE.gnl/Trimastix_PCT/1101~~gnl/Trimastix_PCT/1101.p2  ORF type:complete len:461 (+),score=178.46 gnl/Trimastix_PCT/1101:32-1384(+)
MAEGNLHLLSAIINREKLLALFEPGQAIVLQGGATRHRYDTDVDELFRQESNFMWVTGSDEPDCYCVLDTATKKSVLFCPRPDPEDEIWMGPHETLEHKRERLMIDVQLNDELEAYLTAMGPSKVHILTDEVTFPGKEKFTIDSAFLTPTIHEARVFKNEHEIELIRRANRLSDVAMREIMKAIKPGMKEHEVEALWRYVTFREGGPKCKMNSFHPICASGHWPSILHYHHNDKTLEEGFMILLDAGVEVLCHCSDVSRTFPISGRYSEKQRQIYELVLKAQNSVIAELKPGVNWEDMHFLAARIIVEGLRDLGILVGDLDEMLEKQIWSFFMPHGLGHLMGLACHDVGGFPNGIGRRTDPGFRCLRLRRTLLKDMVVTVEPGCYFTEMQIEKCLANPDTARFVNREKIEEYKPVGGVRIEDDLVITETGSENLTYVPKAVADIEACMRV